MYVPLKLILISFSSGLSGQLLSWVLRSSSNILTWHPWALNLHLCSSWPIWDSARELFPSIFFLHLGQELVFHLQAWQMMWPDPQQGTGTSRGMLKQTRHFTEDSILLILASSVATLLPWASFTSLTFDTLFFTFSIIICFKSNANQTQIKRKSENKTTKS